MFSKKPKHIIHDEVAEIFSELSGNTNEVKNLSSEEHTCNGLPKPKLVGKSAYDLEPPTELPFGQRARKL